MEGPLAGAPPMPVDTNSVPPGAQRVAVSVRASKGCARWTTDTSVVTLVSPGTMSVASDS